MPRTVLDAATAEEALSGLKLSAGSIANTGLILIGIMVSVSLISRIFKRLFLDKIDGFRSSRSWSGSERPWSSAPLVDSRIRENELGSLSRHQLRQSDRQGRDRL